MYKKIKISKKAIWECQNSRKFRRAYALAVIVKFNYGNSVVFNWSPNKLTSLCHAKFSTIKEAAETAIEMGIASDTVFTKSGKEHRNLLFNKIHGDSPEAAFLFATTNATGHLVIYLENKERTNRLAAESSEGAQSFKSVCDILAKLAILLDARVHEKIVNSSKQEKSSSLEDNSQEYQNGLEKITYANSGLTYRTLARKFGDGSYSERQIGKMVREMKRDRIIDTRQSSARIFKDNPDYPDRYINMFTVTTMSEQNRSQSSSLKDKLKAVSYTRTLYGAPINWRDYRGDEVLALNHSYRGNGRNNDSVYRPLGNLYRTMGCVIYMDKAYFNNHKVS